MTRNIFVRRTGTAADGRPWAQGCIDLTDAESMSFIRAGGKPTSRVTGILNGLPDAAVGKLTVGDNLAASELTLGFASDTYKDEEGNEKPSVNVNIRLAGKVSRVAAPVAECDW